MRSASVELLASAMQNKSSGGFHGNASFQFRVSAFPDGPAASRFSFPDRL
jgi:hypothetical protein